MIKTNEGWFDFWKSPGVQGKNVLNRVVKENLQKFEDWLGRNDEEYNEVTWENVYKFLKLQAVFSFENDDLSAVIKSPRLRKRMEAVIPDATKRHEYEKTWLKLNEPVGGADTVGTPEERSNIAKQICDEVIKVAAIRYMNKKIMFQSE